MERVLRREVAAVDVAAGQIELRALGVERQIGNGEVVVHAASIVEPLGIHRGNGANVDQVNLLDERRSLRPSGL